MTENDPLVRFCHFLDWVIYEYGLYLLLIFVWLCPLIIWWVHRWAKKHPGNAVRPTAFIFWWFPPRK
jgi:hypothetical protein